MRAWLTRRLAQVRSAATDETVTCTAGSAVRTNVVSGRPVSGGESNSPPRTRASVSPKGSTERSSWSPEGRTERSRKPALKIAIIGGLVAGAGCAHTKGPDGTASYQTQVAYSDDTLAKPQTMLPADGSTVALFDGTSWEGWVTRNGRRSSWLVQDDGSVVADGSDAVSTRSFGDFQLHVEFLCPPMAGKQGQARANSGVYLHGRYEVQVLDSYGQEPAPNGCGAVYSIAKPLVNASLPPGQWQTYDIVFRAPRYEPGGRLLEHARVTVVHNGTAIHNNLRLPKATPGAFDRGSGTMGPILLQYHGDPVRYRNIWVRPLN